MTPAGMRETLLHRRRTQAAVMVGADESDVIFTSGATEANHIVLLSPLLLAYHFPQNNPLILLVPPPAVLEYEIRGGVS